MRNLIQLFLAVCLILSFGNIQAQNEAQQLIKEVVTAAGGIENLRSLQDVEYQYTFQSKDKGIKDVSVERYIFDGEISFAQYTARQYFVLPQMEGDLTQYFDGTKTVSHHNGQVITDEQAAYVGHFFRKTNFYWFTMMYKLLDPGIQFKMMEDRKVDNTNYQVVEMTFNEGVGETSDRYVLYINPETKMIDQFLFTVLGFGFKEPFLMKMKYEEVDGLMLSTYRAYAPANWEGKVIKEDWTEEISTNIKFKNNFDKTNITKI
ncbi:MAG: DUF6503 family protein [Bacteroidota bacterium]